MRFQGIEIVFSDALPAGVAEFHHVDGRIDVFHLGGAAMINWGAAMTTNGQTGPIYQQVHTPAGTVTFRLDGDDLTLDRGNGLEPAAGIIPKRDIPGVKAAMRESA